MNEQPVARRNGVLVMVTDKVIDTAALDAFATDSAAGGTVAFSGTVRDHSPGRDGVSHLEYEAYSDVAEQKIASIIDEAFDQWPILKVAAVHRTGSLAIGESAVYVVVSCAHRKDSFAACRFVIDELKSRVPIWKKEHWSGGAEWVAEGDPHRPTTDNRQPTTD